MKKKIIVYGFKLNTTEIAYGCLIFCLSCFYRKKKHIFSC